MKPVMKKLTAITLALCVILATCAFPAMVYATSCEEDVQESVIMPRVSYGMCDVCGELTLCGTPGTMNMGDNVVEGCPFYPGQVHMHRIILSYTNYHCTSCGYSVRADYSVAQSICLA